MSLRSDLSLLYRLETPTGRPETDVMPLVVVMHGRGADANDLADLAPMLDSSTGCRFAFPQAPKPWEMSPGTAYGFSWFDGWPPQGSSFDDSRKAVLRFLEEISRRCPTPAGKLVICGFSQGALMALDVGFRTPLDVSGIVAMSGAIHEADLPDLSSRKQRPVLVIHGSLDDVIPVLAARRTRHVLEEHGITPEYHEFPMGHQVSEASMAVVGEFLGRVLG